MSCLTIQNTESYTSQNATQSIFFRPVLPGKGLIYQTPQSELTPCKYVSESHCYVFAGISLNVLNVYHLR